MTDHSSTSSEPVLIDRDRGVRGTLSDPGGSVCVVACPPHPQMGGSRTDRRLTAVSDALFEEDIASLRFDYGEWDEGRGEYTDTLNTIEWATDHYERVGLYGFSFGATLALIAATERSVVCVCVLAPGARIGDRDAIDALQKLECPVKIVYGERDTTTDWKPVVERAEEVGHTVVPMSADHFFVGQTGAITEQTAEFFQTKL